METKMKSAKMETEKESAKMGIKNTTVELKHELDSYKKENVKLKAQMEGAEARSSDLAKDVDRFLKEIAEVKSELERECKAKHEAQTKLIEVTTRAEESEGQYTELILQHAKTTGALEALQAMISIQAGVVDFKK